MDDPRIPYGCLPILVGGALVVLGSRFLIEPLQSVGLLVLVGGVMVLVLAGLGRA